MTGYDVAMETIKIRTKHDTTDIVCDVEKSAHSSNFYPVAYLEITRSNSILSFISI